MMASESLNGGSPLVPCPCQEIGSAQSIRAALDSDERTNALVKWLSDAEGRRLSCQPQQPDLGCTRRVGASFSILNGVRDAVRPFLETTTVKSSVEEPTYEESFPSLSKAQWVSTPNVVVARKKTKKKVVPKAGPAKEEGRMHHDSVPTWGNARGDIAKLLSSTTSTPEGDNNKRTTSEWPVIAVTKESISSGSSVATKKTKRQIRPAPATAWGPAAPGNISTLTSADTMQVPTKADFDKVKHTVVWPMTKVDDLKLQSKATLVAKVEHGCSAIPLDNTANLKPKQYGKTSHPQQENSECDRKKELQNLARIYSSLIRHHLVPSTALELQLLVRLLTANEDLATLSTIAENEKAPAFQALFASARYCHYFAIDVLTQVKCILRNLPANMIEAFLNCPPFASMLPDLTDELKGAIEHRTDTPLLPEVETMCILGSAHPQMPLLTLPFDHDRDSRHNYKSRDELEIYKNREESRDAFLYQLRAFQNIRGTVVDAVQAERAVDRIRTASRNVIQGLLKSNMCWFAQLFCDLLVQIGLVPMEETDKELLSITDKDKLQVSHIWLFPQRRSFYCILIMRVSLHRNYTNVFLQKAHKHQRVART